MNAYTWLNRCMLSPINFKFVLSFYSRLFFYSKFYYLDTNSWFEIAAFIYCCHIYKNLIIFRNTIKLFFSNLGIIKIREEVDIFYFTILFKLIFNCSFTYLISSKNIHQFSRQQCMQLWEKKNPLTKKEMKSNPIHRRVVKIVVEK